MPISDWQTNDSDTFFQKPFEMIKKAQKTFIKSEKKKICFYQNVTFAHIQWNFNNVLTRKLS